MKTIPKDIKTKYWVPKAVQLYSVAKARELPHDLVVVISADDLVRLDYKAEANDRTRQILLRLMGLTDAGYPLGKPKTSDTLAGEVARMFTREAENHIASEKDAARARVDAGRQRDRAEHAEASLRAERKWHEETLAKLRKANQEFAEWRPFPSDCRVETVSKSGGTSSGKPNASTSTRLDGKPDVKCNCCGLIHADPGCCDCEAGVCKWHNPKGAPLEDLKRASAEVVSGLGIYATNDMEKGDVMLIDMDRGTATSIGKMAPAPKADPTAKALMERIDGLEREREDLNRNLATAQGWVGQLGAENGRLKGELMDAKIKLSDINNALGRIEGLASKLKNAAGAK